MDESKPGVASSGSDTQVLGPSRRASWTRCREQVLHCAFYRGTCARATLSKLEQATAEHVSFIGDTGILPPSPFLCVLVRYAGCKPSLEQVARHLEQTENTYWRAIAATWLRWTETKAERVYRLLDPFFGDYRTIMIRAGDGSLQSTHFDVYIDQLLRYRSTFGALQEPFPISIIPFPYIISRYELEARGSLPVRQYAVSASTAAAADEPWPLYPLPP